MRRVREGRDQEGLDVIEFCFGDDVFEIELLGFGGQISRSEKGEENGEEIWVSVYKRDYDVFT